MLYIYKSRCLPNLVSFIAFVGFRDRSAASGKRGGSSAPDILAIEEEYDRQTACLEKEDADEQGPLFQEVQKQAPHLIPTEDVKITSFNLLSAALRTEPFEVDPPEHEEFIGLIERHAGTLKELESAHPRALADSKDAEFERDRRIGVELSGIYKDSLMMAIYYLIRTYMISAVNGNYKDYKGDTRRIQAQTLMGITVQGLFMEPGNRQYEERQVSFQEFRAAHDPEQGMNEKEVFAYWNRLTPVSQDSVVVDRSDHRLTGMLLSTWQTFSKTFVSDSEKLQYANTLRDIAQGKAPLKLDNFYKPSIRFLAFNPECDDNGLLTINSCPCRSSSSAPDVLSHWLNSNTLQWLKDDVKQVYKIEETKPFALGQANKNSKTTHKRDRLSLGNLQPFKCTDTWASPSGDIVADAGQWFDHSKRGQHDWMKLRVYDLLTLAVRNRVLYTFYKMSFEEMMQDWPLLRDEDDESLVHRLKASHYLLKAAGANRFYLLEKLRSSACAALAEGSNPRIQASRLQAYLSDPQSIQPQVVLLQEADRSLWSVDSDGESFRAKPEGYRVVWPDAMAAEAGKQAALTTDNSIILIQEEFLKGFFENEEIPEFDHILRRPSAKATEVLHVLKKIKELMGAHVREHANATLERVFAALPKFSNAVEKIMHDDFSIPVTRPDSQEMSLPILTDIINVLEKELRKRNEIERRLLVKYESSDNKNLLILGSVHFSSQAGEAVFATEVKDYIDEVLKTMADFGGDGKRMAIFGGDLNVDPRPKTQGGNLSTYDVYDALQRQAERSHLTLLRLTSPGPGRRSYMKKLSPLQAQVTKTDEPHGGAIDHIYVIIPQTMGIKFMDASDPWMGSVFEVLPDFVDRVEDIYTSESKGAKITGYSARDLQLPLILSAETKSQLGDKAITVSSDHLPVNVHINLAW